MRFIYLFLFLFCGNLSFGQTYPVQVLVNVPSPYSFYLSDYVSGSQERFIVTLLNRDIQYVSMPVRLKLTVKGNGFSLQSSSYASVPPIVLEPNVPYRLSMEELLPYFDTRNLIGQGLGASGYLKGTRLPEGMLEFTVEVLEYQTNRLLSRQGNAMIFLSLQKPPQLSLPFDGEILSWKEPLHILFQWTPQHSGVARVEYELIIKELWDTGMDPSSAFAFSPEIFRERITTTSYAYGPLCPALEPGHKYAWCVRVIAKDGIDDIRIFENDGLSLIRTFRIGCYCPDPLALQSETKRGNITLTWKGAPEHGEYSIAYRLKGTDNWHEERAYSSPAQLFGIRPGQTYEYKVGGVCFDGGISYTSIQSVTLPSEDTSRQHSCGILPPVDLSNTAPLEELYEGEMFWAGDFPVEVTSATGGSGIFSGEGNISVPYLLFHRFAVRFDNVFINSDRRMVRGFVETVYDESDGSVGNLDNIFEGGAATGEIASGITYADIDLSFTIPDDGNCTYDSLTSQVHVYDGDDEIGVIDLSGLLASSGENTSSVSGESIFPITVKDSDGNLYSLEPETDTPVDSSGNTPLKVRKVGSSGGALPEGSVFYDRLDGEIGLVTFRDVDGSRYEFDTWNPVYSGSLLIRDKYERLDRDYYVPCKLLPSGASDRVVAHLEIRGSDVDPNKIKFLTRQGTEYVPESFNAESGDYILSLVGGKENDGQELYALYPKPDSGYYNLGKLLILSYPSYSFPVKIVSVGGGLPAEEFSALRQNLENLFSRYGIRCDVSYDETVYSDLQMFDKGSGLLSAYNSRMKAFNRHYASTRELDEGCSYLFVFPESGYKRNRDFSGFMPRNCQFGYVFRQDFTGFDSFCLAVAHELCHGRLSLKHIFDNSYGLSEGDLAENLMDYRDGSHLAKWQWDLIHDPGVVVRIFERDKDAEKVNKDGFKVQETLRIIRLILTKEVDYRFKNINAEASDIQIGNNRYKKIKISSVSEINTVNNSSNVINFENLSIELANKDEVEKMRNFIYGLEKDIYGKSYETIVLDGEEITLEVIGERMEEILINLLNNNKYDQLTYAQKIILNIPIIQWKLGYHYGAAFMYFWFNGENRNIEIENQEYTDENYKLKIDDRNFEELFGTSLFFQKHLNFTLEEVAIGKLYNVPTSLKCLDNIKNAIENNRNMYISIPGDYKEPDKSSPDYGSFLYSHAVSFYNTVDMFNNTVIDDDFAYAIGSFAILVSMEGELEIQGKDAGTIKFPNLFYRLWDSFDFVGEQSLGNWNGDVFDATKVSLAFTNTAISNSDFREFYQKYTGKIPVKDRTPWDFDAVTKNYLLNRQWGGISYKINNKEEIEYKLVK